MSHATDPEAVLADHMRTLKSLAHRSGHVDEKIAAIEGLSVFRDERCVPTLLETLGDAMKNVCCAVSLPPGDVRAGLSGVDCRTAVQIASGERYAFEDMIRREHKDWVRIAIAAIKALSPLGDMRCAGLLGAIVKRRVVHHTMVSDISLPPEIGQGMVAMLTGPDGRDHVFVPSIVEAASNALKYLPHPPPTTASELPPSATEPPPTSRPGLPPRAPGDNWQAGPAIKSSFREWAAQAVTAPASLQMEFAQIPALLDALREAQLERDPESDMGGIGRRLDQAFTFHCPRCGQLKSSTVIVAPMVANIGAQSPQTAVVFGGPNTASLGQGRCPGCGGTTVSVFYDPRVMRGLTRRPNAGRLGVLGIKIVAWILISTAGLFLVGTVGALVDPDPDVTKRMTLLGAFISLVLFITPLSVGGWFLLRKSRRFSS